MSVANLPMYDLPGLRQATDDWWAGLARALRVAGIDRVPRHLDRQRTMDEVWRDPDLLISQTCGYPLTHGLAGQVRLVATPAYDVEGCEGASYRSAFVVRNEDSSLKLADLRDRRVAINSSNSQSGYNCLRRALAQLAVGGPFFAEVVESGGHGASLTAVRENRADLAAVDGVTFALTARTESSAVAGLRVLDWSAAAPGLPYVTRADAGDDEVAALRAGLLAAVADPDLAEARAALTLAGFEILPLEAYDVINRMEAEAIALGYPEIA